MCYVYILKSNLNLKASHHNYVPMQILLPPGVYPALPQPGSSNARAQPELPFAKAGAIMTRHDRSPTVTLNTDRAMSMVPAFR